jgi:hypothetical protein
MAPGERLDRPVEVLGVRVALADRDVEHARLLAKLLDRVDLTVVAEHAEGLDARERRPGIGRVSVVAEGADRLRAPVGEVGVVGPENLRVAHHLVDGRLAGEGGDVDAELLLEGDLQVEDRAVRAGCLRNEPRELPELGLLLTSCRAEGGGVDGADPLGEDPESRPAQELAGAVADLLQVL